MTLIRVSDKSIGRCVLAHEYEVLICGAGPVGLSLAAQLDAMGISYMIIDKNLQRSEKSKALVLWGRSLELLNLCMDVNAFLKAGRPVSQAKIFEEGKEIAGIDFTSTGSEFGTGVLLPQNQTERLLEEHLSEQGQTVKRGIELVSFEQRDQEVWCQLKDRSGAEEQLSVRYLVGCDGAHSVVRHTLGMPFPGRKDCHRWVLADVRLEGDFPDSDVAAYWSHAGVLLLFHFGQDVWRVVAEEPLDDPDSPRRDPSLEEIARLLRERGATNVQASEPSWLAEFRINERKVDRYRSGGVFLAGDAAHVHSPAGGQGMNTGIQDACNLAWKIAWNVRGVGGEFLLDSYSDERSRVGAMVVRTTSHVTRMVTTQSRVLQRLRNTVAKIALRFEWVQEFARQNLAEYTVAYRRSTLNGADSRRQHKGLRCGDRVPNIKWVDSHGQRQSLYQQLSGGRAALITCNLGEAVGWEGWQTLDDSSSPSYQWIGLASSPVAVEAGIHQGDAAHKWGVMETSDMEEIGIRDGGWLIIRPDGYLAVAGSTSDMKPAVDWLNLVAGA